MDMYTPQSGNSILQLKYHSGCLETRLVVGNGCTSLENWIEYILAGWRSDSEAVVVCEKAAAGGHRAVLVGSRVDQ